MVLVVFVTEIAIRAYLIIFELIFVKLAEIQERHKISNEFKF